MKIHCTLVGVFRESALMMPDCFLRHRLGRGLVECIFYLRCLMLVRKQYGQGTEGQEVIFHHLQQIYAYKGLKTKNRN
jgi:hypothetical protein